MSPINKPTVLYISYDGMLEPLGQSQVLSYLEKLSSTYNIIIISYEKQDDLINIKKFNSIKSRINAANIVWFNLRYHKRWRLLSTLYDVLLGTLLGLFVIYKHKVDLIHSRSYIGSTVALLLKKLTRTNYLFDIRGFWVDEKRESNGWSNNSMIYIFLKKLESILFSNAAHIVSLTIAARSEIQYNLIKSPPKDLITVIPTCVNLEKFKFDPKCKEEILGYVGSIGEMYDFKKTIEIYKSMSKHIPFLKYIIINKGEHELIRNTLFKSNVDMSMVSILSSDHSDMPTHLKKMKYGVFCYKNAYSRLACSPTRLGEYIASGVACITTSGVGDVDNIIKDNRLGVIWDRDKSKLDDCILNLIQITNDSLYIKRCLEFSSRYYSLDDGVCKYSKIYQKLLEH